MGARLFPPAASVFDFIPGFVSQDAYGTVNGNVYMLRGFFLDHGTDFSFWVDDVPLNQVNHVHLHGFADVNSLIPAQVFARGTNLSGPAPSYYAVSVTRGLQVQLVRVQDGENAVHVAGIEAGIDALDEVFLPRHQRTQSPRMALAMMFFWISLVPP